METKLTPSQSQRLIELGVDPSKASMCMLYFPESDSSEPLESWQMWEENGKLLCNPDESQVQDVEFVIVPKDADYDLSAKEEHPIFTLSDILSLLPKRISKNDACLTIIANYNDWWVGYEYDSALSGKIDSVAGYPAPELIDALYELLCWILKNSPRQNLTPMNGIIIDGKVYEVVGFPFNHCDK